jgi:hypothetical protein
MVSEHLMQALDEPCLLSGKRQVTMTDGFYRQSDDGVGASARNTAAPDQTWEAKPERLSRELQRQAKR